MQQPLTYIFQPLLYSKYRQDFAVVCSVIDTKYDVLMWEEQKSGSRAADIIKFLKKRNKKGKWLLVKHGMGNPEMEWGM
jgi:hypothetical protein